MSEALKQLSVLDTLSRTVATLKCSLERLAKNGTKGSTHPPPPPARLALVRPSVSASASTPDGCCPLGWELSGASCFLFNKSPMTWPDARDWCNGHESQLAILHSDEEWVSVRPSVRRPGRVLSLMDGLCGLCRTS